MLLQGEIKAFDATKTDAIMKIWLDATIQAHRFIPQSYWAKKFIEVKRHYLPISETFICEEDGEVKGFISLLEGDYIGALFVDTHSQGRGVGTGLLDRCKDIYDQLELNVYSKNKSAVSFYEKNGFVIEGTKQNEETGEEEYVMTWVSNDALELLFSLPC